MVLLTRRVKWNSLTEDGEFNKILIGQPIPITTSNIIDTAANAA